MYVRNKYIKSFMKEVNISEVSSRQLLITCSMSQCTSEHVSNPTRNVSAMLDSNIAMHLFNISSPLYLRKEKIHRHRNDIDGVGGHTL